MLHFDRNDPMQPYKHGQEWLESCLAEKDLGVLVNSQPNTSQTCAQVVKRDNSNLACNRNIVGKRAREVIVTLYAALVVPHLQYCAQFGVHFCKKDIMLLECIQIRVTKLVKDLEKKTYEEQGKEWRSFNQEADGRPNNYLQVPESLFPQVTRDRTQANGLSCTMGILDWILGRISSQKQR